MVRVGVFICIRSNNTYNNNYNNGHVIVTTSAQYFSTYTGFSSVTADIQ